MHNGFYAELDEFRGECDGEFAYLENEDAEGQSEKSAYEFLHGYCNVFAEALHDMFGFRVENIYDDGMLVHSYCVADTGNRKLFMDIRGVTDDYEEFVAEFGDFLEYEGTPQYPLPGTTQEKDEILWGSDFYKDAIAFIEYYGYWDEEVIKKVS